MTNDGTAIDAAMGTDALPGRDVLDKATLQRLSERSDAPGIRRTLGHLAIILVTGWLLSEAYAYGGIVLIPALILHGFSLVTLFAPTHEAGHATAFKSPWIGKAVAVKIHRTVAVAIGHKLTPAHSTSVGSFKAERVLLLFPCQQE